MAEPLGPRRAPLSADRLREGAGPHEGATSAEGGRAPADVTLGHKKNRSPEPTAQTAHHGSPRGSTDLPAGAKVSSARPPTRPARTAVSSNENVLSATLESLFNAARRPTERSVEPLGLRAFLNGLQAPASTVSVSGKQAQTREEVLPGLPQGAAKERPVRLSGSQALQAFFAQWFAPTQAIGQEVRSHGARPILLQSWRTPVGAAKIAAPTPMAASLQKTKLKIGPQIPGREDRPRAIAVVARQRQAPVVKDAAAAAATLTPASVIMVPPSAPQASALGDNPTMTSLASPRSPTALGMGLSVPKPARLLTAKQKQAQQEAEERARTKRRFAAFTRLQERRDFGEDEQDLGEKPRR